MLSLQVTGRHATECEISVKDEMQAPGQVVQENLQDFLVQNIAKLFSQ